MNKILIALTLATVIGNTIVAGAMAQDNCNSFQECMSFNNGKLRKDVWYYNQADAQYLKAIAYKLDEIAKELKGCHEAK